MVSSRKSRNYKGKRPMFAFGQLVLPIAAVLALGLLFTGIKLFFFAPPGTHTSEPIEYVPQPASQDYSADVSSKWGANTTHAESKDRVPQKKAGGSSIVLAGPVDPATEAVTPVMKSSNEVKKGTPVTPAKKTAEKNTPSKEPVEKQKAEKKVTSKKETKANTAETQTPTRQSRVKPIKTEPTVTSKPTVKAPTPTIVPSLKSGTLWGVQIGAFTKREGADILAEQAKKDGYSPIVSQYEVEGKQFFRVRVKSGTDRDVAATVAAELEKKGYPVALVPLN